jgi:7-cyano-7-deazaguanine synthase
VSKYVLIYSGGLDSTVLLYRLLAEGHRVAALSINYGQRHLRELRAARMICSRLNVLQRVVDLDPLRELLAGSSQTDDRVRVPEGHYTEESMKATIVPNRNMILLAVAGAWAISSRADVIAYAAHGGDHAIYPDCRAEFVEALEEALKLADWHTVKIEAPFLWKTKTDIVKLGHELLVPFEDTWSCYKGEELHCGKCGTCVERKEAFKLACVKDPTIYA